jgi:hypothetical protein
MASNDPSFPNFKEAFCAIHRCRPDQFVSTVLNRSIPIWFRPLAALTFRFNPRLFSVEVDVIESMGRSSSGREVTSAVSELQGLRRVERSFWRSIGLRADEERLLEQWARVRPVVTQKAVPDFVEQPILAPAVHSSSNPQREVPAVVVRKARQLHLDITSGRPVGEVLAAAGLNEAEFLRLLEAHAAGNPGLAWLHGQMLLGQRIRDLETQNESLSKTVTAQSVEINRLQSATAPN